MLFPPLSRRFFGTAPCHLGEIWQGVVPGPAGPVRALMTLPSALFQTRVQFEPRIGELLEVEPSHKTKARAAALEVLRLAGADGVGGCLVVPSTIPEGRGMGSSTSEILATIRAVRAAVGEASDAELETEILLHIDGAVDPISFGPRAMLYAHREGRLIEDFGPLPEMSLRVFDLEPGSTSVDTQSFQAPEYDANERAEHASIVVELREAVAWQDASAIGALATRSAWVNQRYLPKPHFDEVLDAALDAGAHGVSVAHTGTIAVVILGQEVEARADRALQEHLEGLGARYLAETSIVGER